MRGNNYSKPFATVISVFSNIQFFSVKNFILNVFSHCKFSNNIVFQYETAINTNGLTCL